MDISRSETPSTAQHSSSFEEIFTPIYKITQAISAKDLKIIGNEALTLYTKLETDKLQMHAKELNKTCIKLEGQTEQILKHQKELAASNEESRKSLALQSNMLLILQTQYESFKTKIDGECNSYKTTYKEYAEKYKKAECVYETHHPRYKRLKELEIESRKKEVEYRMLKQKIAEERKRFALRYEIQRQMFHCSIVKFVQAVVTYWKARDLSVQLKEAAKREQELIQKLQDLELLVVKKEKERQLVEKKAATTKQSPTPQFKLPAVKLPAVKFPPPPPPASTASYPISSFTQYEGSNKGADNSNETSRSSTFSQKYQQLSEILAKEIPEIECEVTSAPMTNPSTTANITSPFFNKTKTMDTGEAKDNNTMQAPLEILKDTMFAGKSIEELLDNSALFHDQEMPTESRFIEEDQPLFSPDYSMNAEPDLNMQPGQSSALSFNFQQPQSAQANETKSFFSTASGLFNMFS